MKRNPLGAILTSLRVKGVYLIPLSIPLTILVFLLRLYPQIVMGKILSYRSFPLMGVFEIHFLMDRLSLGFGILISAVYLFVTIYSVEYIQTHRLKYYSMLTLNLVSMLGLILARDLLGFYIFFEMVSFSGYFLIIHSRAKEALAAGYKYIVMMLVGGFFILMAMMALFMASAAQERWSGVAAICFAIGCLLKAGAFPFHTWLPDAHSIAPSPVSAILSGIVIKVGIYAFFRAIRIFSFSPIIGNVYTLLLYTGAVTAVFGAIMAFVQSDLKRLLAYSSINQIGYILIGIGLGTQRGTAGALFHSANHAVAKSCLFLCAGVVIERTGKRKISDLGMVAKEMPGVTTIFILASLSLMGIPPAGGFFSKLIIGLAAAKSGHPLIAFTIFVTSVITGAYFLRCIGFFFRGAAGYEITGKRFSTLAYLALILLVSGVFIVVFLPGAGEQIVNFVSMSQNTLDLR